VDTIVASVAKTGRLLVVDEAYAMCGIGAEIAAIVVEQAFDELDAPIGRLHTEPVSHPFSPVLEDAVTASAEKIVAAARAVMDGRPPLQHRALGALHAPAVQSRSDGDGHDPSFSPLAKPPSMPSSPIPQTGAGAGVKASAIQSGVPVVMPNMDLIITEAMVVSWAKEVGEKVAKGEPLLEIETDKAVTNVESPANGVLVEILADVGVVVPLGQQLGTRHRRRRRHWQRPQWPHHRGRRAVCRCSPPFAFR
jgi:2-oxoisovalerate dehydrogenase E1 component